MNKIKNFEITCPVRKRIGWRITATAFLTVLLFQTVTLAMEIKEYEESTFQSLSYTVKSTITPSLRKTNDNNESPLQQRYTPDLVKNTLVKGISFYNMDKKLVGKYGDETKLNIDSKGELVPTFAKLEESQYYEFLYTPAQIDLPYYMVVKADLSGAKEKVLSYLIEEMIVLVLISFSVTMALMFVLGRWLISPIQLLNRNLARAIENPENPIIEDYYRTCNDEVSVVINNANSLIKQNAGNLKRLKSQAEDKIHRLAYFDTITGLPNRTYFLEQLEDILREKKFDRDFRFIVMSVDIDHFKDINDSMGHEIGDMLLEAVGKRLVKSMPDSALISRASADEFLMMIELNKFHPDSSKMIEKIMETMEEPVSIIQERFQVRVSIGAAEYPTDAIEAKQIIKNADIALNRAKDEGRNTARYYSEEFDMQLQHRFQLLRDLRQALEKEQLDVYYQPQFDLKTGALIGCEALLRWWKPGVNGEEGRFVPPSEIFPVAEHSGLIVPIGEYVLRKSCRAAKKWQKMGLPPFKVAVNIGWEQFHKCNLVKLVKDVLQETGLEAKYLELEVVEGTFMENMKMATEILYQLHQMGVEVAIDDFGTGYSSLSYLRQLPIDRLKIDQSFIRDALVDKDDRTITTTIITLGHNLGMKVIAEGVETLEQQEFLKLEGCDEVQGWKYSKAIPDSQLVEFVKNHQPETITK